MKKRIGIFMAMVLVMTMSMTLLSGCKIDLGFESLEYTEREVGDFIVRFYSDEESGDEYCMIKGTTEQGNSKRFLVIPSFIDGVRVETLGIYNLFSKSFDIILMPEIESDTIEKVYFESAIKMSPASFQHGYQCPNLDKIMYLGIESSTHYMRYSDTQVYYPRKMHEKANEEGLFLKLNHSVLPANVSYYYNYTDSDNEGYYWIDDCDYGGKIEYIPNEPTREGYTFGGWYKESDCINEWDFEVDILPEEIKYFDEYDNEITKYQETILYAKWIKN